jgi:hypothetical protein
MSNFTGSDRQQRLPRLLCTSDLSDFPVSFGSRGSLVHSLTVINVKMSIIAFDLRRGVHLASLDSGSQKVHAQPHLYSSLTLSLPQPKVNDETLCSAKCLNASVLKHQGVKSVRLYNGIPGTDGASALILNLRS